MTTKEYNGWTNYETWVVSLWIDNEEGSHSYWREQARELSESVEMPDYMHSSWTKRDEATRQLADKLKDEHENASQDILVRSDATASIWSDLLGAALSEVNWQEIATNMLDAVEEVA